MARSKRHRTCSSAAAPAEALSECLLDPEHAENLRTGLVELWRHGDLCDLVLRVKRSMTNAGGASTSPAATEETADVKVHSVVVAAVSKPLRAMICDKKFCTVQDGVLTLHADADEEDSCVSPEALGSVVEYMYTGELKITEATSWAVLSAVNFLELKGARDQCSEFMCRNLTPENALCMVDTARKHGYVALAEMATKYVCTYFESVALEGAWVDRTEEQVREWVRMDALVVKRESSVVQALMRWAEHDVSGVREASLVAIFGDSEAVRLPGLELSELRTLHTSPLAQRSTAVLTHICAEALRRHEPGTVVPTRPRRYTVFFSVPTACEKTLEGHTRAVLAVVPLGEEEVISGSCDETIKVWSVRTGECTRTLQASPPVWSLVLHGGHLLAGLENGDILVWNVSTWTLERTLERHDGVVFCLVMCGDLLISGSSDYTIKVWSTASWSCERTLEGHTGVVHAVVMCGDKLVSCSDDKSIRVWSTASWTCERTIENAHDNWIVCLAVHEGKLLSGSWDKTVKVWDPTTWACERTLPVFEHAVCSLLVCGDSLVVGGNGGMLVVRSFATGEPVRTIDGHSSLMNSLALSGGKLVSASSDFTVKIWG